MDLEACEKLINEKTRCILINNPSNPCGSVFTKEHLLKILDLADKHNLPIVADEIYCDMVFPGNEFHSLASLSKNVPIISVGGIAKKWAVPGWRIGWIMLNDKHERLNVYRKGLIMLSQRILGPNSLAQAALIHILKNTSQVYFDKYTRTLSLHAKYCTERLSNITGLSPITPQGAMYVMVIEAIEIFLIYCRRASIMITLRTLLMIQSFLRSY